jgi:hypothetical protein
MQPLNTLPLPELRDAQVRHVSVNWRNRSAQLHFDVGDERVMVLFEGLRELNVSRGPEAADDRVAGVSAEAGDGTRVRVEMQNGGEVSILADRPGWQQVAFPPRSAPRGWRRLARRSRAS